MYAFLVVEDHIDWFAQLLRQTTDVEFTRNLNETNCVGTVLSLNGPRKSFSLFHAHVQRRDASDSGDFLGFADDADAELILDSELLSGLSVWLERLCEGTVTKYKIKEWPMMSR